MFVCFLLESNVLSIVSHAEEYKIQSLIRRSKCTLMQWLSTEVDTAAKCDRNEDKVKHARTCLTILTKASSFSYDDVVTKAVEVLARFPHEVFTGSLKLPTSCVHAPILGFNFGLSKADEKVTPNKLGPGKTGTTKTCFVCESRSDCHVKECKELFESLSDVIKTRLLLRRLKLCDDGKMR